MDIISSFGRQADVIDDSVEQWQACRNGCGIALDVQNKIMDPRFEDFRLSESCLYWVNDTVQMRYAGLEEIQRSSHAREMELRRLATRSDSR